MVYIGCVRVGNSHFFVGVCVAVVVFVSSPSRRFPWCFESGVVVYPFSIICVVEVVLGFVVVVMVVM